MSARAKTGGRQKGSLNKVTTVFKDAVRIAYDNIGGHEAFSEWAKANPTEFYRIAARLIPTEITNSSAGVQIFLQNPVRDLDSRTPDNWIEVATSGRALT